MVFQKLTAAFLLIFMMGGSLSFAETSDESEKTDIPSFDVLRLRYESQQGLNFDDFDAELDTARYTIGGFLMKPLELGQNWRALPYASYRLTTLDFENPVPGLLLGDQDLHQVSLHGMLFHQAPGSRWSYGAWGRVSLSSDTESITKDDFYYDLGIGAGYKVNDDLLVGFGFVGLEIGRDSRYLPGPFFRWQATDHVSVSLMGPLFTTKWDLNDDWTLALRGAPYGSTWNIKDEGESQDLDLSSYALRLHAERRISEDLWLSVGVGYSFGGSFEVRDLSENQIFKDDLESGLSLSVALKLRSW